MRRPSIPDVPPTFLPSQRDWLHRIKENIEITGGRRGGRIDALPDGSSLEDVVAKINEILRTMQG